jgi:hypothetical protein
MELVIGDTDTLVAIASIIVTKGDTRVLGWFTFECAVQHARGAAAQYSKVRCNNLSVCVTATCFSVTTPPVFVVQTTALNIHDHVPKLQRSLPLTKSENVTCILINIIYVTNKTSNSNNAKHFIHAERMDN